MTCESCTREIPAKRLAAVPNAKYCRDCQPYKKYVPPPHVMAAGAEPDDVTRIREEGWLNGY